MVQHWTGSHSHWCPSTARRLELSDVRHRSRYPTCDSALRPGGTPAAEQLQAEGLREGRCCGSQALNPGGEHYLWHTGNVSALTSTQEVLAQQYAHFFHPHPAPTPAPLTLECAKRADKRLPRRLVFESAAESKGTGFFMCSAGLPMMSSESMESTRKMHCLDMPAGYNAAMML